MAGILAPFLVPLVKFSVFYRKVMDLYDHILLGFGRDKLGFECSFKVCPSSIVYLGACLGGCNMVTGPFPSLGSKFKISQCSAYFLYFGIKGGVIEVVVVLECVPEGNGLICLSIKGLWCCSDDAWLILLCYRGLWCWQWRWWLVSW
jgi:hypothetical protein